MFVDRGTDIKVRCNGLKDRTCLGNPDIEDIRDRKREVMVMETLGALVRFLMKCEERGLSPETVRVYRSCLKQFVQDYPELPTDTRTIEIYLKKHRETPGHRGLLFKRLQALYSYLEEFEGIKSPVPPKGRIGRPAKTPGTRSAMTPSALTSSLPEDENSLQGVTGSPCIAVRTVEAVESFMRSRKVQGVSPRTMEGYLSRFKPFIRMFDTIPLTVEPIEQFLDSIQGTSENKWTYRKHLIALYHFLEERRKIPKGLFKFPLVKVPRKVRRVLTPEELRGLFPHCEGSQEKAILQLFIDSKIRASELCPLTREQVYPDHIIVPAKGGGERAVPIKPETYDTLIQLAPSGRLFSVDGRRLRRDYLGKIIKRIMHRAGLTGKKLGPHILRHSASVEHMMHGGDLLSLKEELGHTTTKMTEVYGALAFPQVKQKHQEVDVLGHIMGTTELERARCYGCGQMVVLEFKELKTTKCPYCGQVGMWYLPDHRVEEPNSSLSEEENSYQGGR